MHRLTPPRVAFVTVLALAVAIGSLLLVARVDVAAHPTAQRGIVANVYMSTTADGPMARNFVSDTSRLYAVIDYENGAGEAFDVQLRDLSGIVVLRRRTPPLTGAGTTSVGISVDDFVASYTSTLATLISAPPRGGPATGGLSDTLSSAVFNCENRPDLPVPWPPPVPTPNPPAPPPTPAPEDPYTRWLKPTRSLIDTSRLTMAEITRTTQAWLGLSGMQDEAGEATREHLIAAQQGYAAASRALSQVPDLLQPQPIGENPPGQPDPIAGCALVYEAAGHAAEANAAVYQAIAYIPADFSTWSLPETLARYDGQRFLACEQYSTEIYLVTSGQVRDTAADSALWTLGDPEGPAMIFGGPEQTDASSIGSLQLSFGGATQIFARSVTVPGVNHEATISGFLTDRHCRPVADQNVSFRMDPNGFGTLSANTVRTDDGYFVVEYQSGDEVPQAQPPNPQSGRLTVHAEVGSGPDEVRAYTQFNVTGPAATFRFIVSPKSINPLENERAGVTVEVRDANGNNVADGTAVTLRLAPSSKGRLAYEQRRGSGPWELVIAGDELELVTQGGNTILPFDPDPGILRRQAVFLIPFGGDGPVTLIAEADGVMDDSDEKIGSEDPKPRFWIQSFSEVYLPMAMKDAQTLPRPTPRPIRIPPTAQPEP